MDFSSQTWCVFDHGLFQPLAHTLARSVGHMFYCRPSRRSHPLTSDKEPGMGYHDIELVESWLDIKDRVDVWVFPDIFDADIQESLVKDGKRVFGSRRGDEMEIHRSEFRDLLKKVGLPVPPYESVIGIDALRERLEVVEDKYIKSSPMVRGTSETWHHIRYNLSQTHIDLLSSKLGALRDTIEFLIDDPIPSAQEVGFDDICVRGKFANHALVGIENKDRAYFGQFMATASMPKELREVNEKLGPIFEQYGYTNFWSSELRGKYLIDPCPRLASPAGECIQAMNANLAERIYAATEGEVVEPKPAAKYSAQVLLVSDEIEQGPLPIDIPEKNREWAYLYNSGMDKDGQEWVTPNATKFSELGSVVGIGNTPEQAVKACEEHCKGIECMKLEIHLDELHEAKSDLSKAA
jgi:hypothetical protein